MFTNSTNKQPLNTRRHNPLLPVRFDRLREDGIARFFLPSPVCRIVRGSFYSFPFLRLRTFAFELIMCVNICE